jgi:hypothetical protein
LEVQPELHSLLAAVPGADRVVPFDVTKPMPALHDIEIMELQHALRLPATEVGYLQVPPTPVPGATTGVCWRAGGWQPARSVPLDLLRPWLPEGAVSLQRGEVGLPDPLAGSMDVRVTAGLVASLARVVTVDTMIAHLAGALGRPVHLLLKADADWRWGLGGRTAWYPATRIYRQAVPGDWSEPLARLADALRVGD